MAVIVRFAAQAPIASVHCSPLPVTMASHPTRLSLLLFCSQAYSCHVFGAKHFWTKKLEKLFKEC